MASGTGVQTRARYDLADDSGGAIVEFIAITLLLLIPVVYLVVTVARIQAGILAAEAASYEAARASVVEGVWQLDHGASTYRIRRDRRRGVVVYRRLQYRHCGGGVDAGRTSGGQAHRRQRHDQDGGNAAL